MSKLQSVVSAYAVRDFVLNIVFEDSKAFVLDFKPWIDSESGWLFEPLKEAAYFARVGIHGGALEWPNGLDICADGLRSWCDQGSIPLPLTHLERVMPFSNGTQTDVRWIRRLLRA